MNVATKAPPPAGPMPLPESGKPTTPDVPVGFGVGVSPGGTLVPWTPEAGVFVGVPSAGVPGVEVAMPGVPLVPGVEVGPPGVEVGPPGVNVTVGVGLF